MEEGNYLCRYTIAMRQAHAWLQVVMLCMQSDESKPEMTLIEQTCLVGSICRVLLICTVISHWASKLGYWTTVPEKVTSNVQLADHLQNRSVSQPDQHLAVSETDHSYVADLLHVW